MQTPICDFVRRYAAENPVRMHMPGHKGLPLLGMESLDITEIPGADSLYEADGIIRESERNASALFETADTLYSTEGSSLCIRAMLALALTHARSTGREPLVLAARNVHKTFVTAAGLLHIPVQWLPPASDTYLSSPVQPAELERMLAVCHPTAVYITSPDYLGICADVRTIAELCHRYEALLLVDNAHGAYRKFLPVSQHPMDLGADICCDSAHKTLPALTGTAYLHLSRTCPPELLGEGKQAMALFGSTSPSYLLLQSLDAVNRYLADGFREKIREFLPEAAREKQALTEAGYTFAGDEPLKWTLCAKAYGYTGTELSDRLAEKGIVCEFADPDYVVMMLSCEAGKPALQKLTQALRQIERRPALHQPSPTLTHLPVRVCPIWETFGAPAEEIPSEQAEGRVLAALNVACPPAVPIAVCGERIDKEAVALFRYYGVKTCRVLCE